MTTDEQEFVTIDAGDEALVQLSERPPEKLLVVDLLQSVLFPGMTVPVYMPDQRQAAIVEQAWNQTRFLGMVSRKHEPKDPDNPVPGDLYRIGVAAKLLRFVRRNDGSVHAVVQSLARMKIKTWLRTEPMLFAEVTYPEESFGERVRTEALFQRTRDSIEAMLELMPNIPEEFNLAVLSIEGGPRGWPTFVAGNFEMKLAQRQELLECFNVTERLEKVLLFLTGELEVRRLGQRIQEEIQGKIEQSQKEYYLREQLKLIRRELGDEVDEREHIAEEYERRIEESGMSEEAEERARRELQRLSVLTPEASDYHVIKTYLDWLTELPWDKRSEEDIDVVHAQEVLDADHYGLDEVKERIIEYLAVRKLNPEQRGAILCLSGPPGVGKTSLGRSLARSLGREFYRFSLGGMRDEAEIKGHRRTYVGAMPGKIIQGLHRVGSRNPLFMLDEIDKLGSDWRGDPSSAMLEVLDPEQNATFLDHYLDVRFDLSEVMFICTANVKSNIPGPLLDRMEVIDLSSYIDDEKYHIAARHLFPRQRQRHGLKASQLKISKAAYLEIIDGYTRESGVRNLDRKIARICRKTAAAVARGDDTPRSVTGKNVDEYLGPRKFTSEIVKRGKRPGVAIGLAWTPVGGDVLFIEVIRTKGKGRMRITGQLGEVMSESVQIALSYVKSEAKRFDIDCADFEEMDLHIHFPAGAIPKDGPSAGVTITTALVSLLTGGKGRVIRSRLAMTGEITLTGRVLPVGGIREKVIAARRAGCLVVVLPAQNEKDLVEIPDHIREGLAFHFAETYRDVYDVAFG